MPRADDRVIRAEHDPPVVAEEDIRHAAELVTRLVRIGDDRLVRAGCPTS